VSGGVITEIKVTNPGINYTSAPVVFISGSGIGASAEAILAPAGTYQFEELVTGSISGATGKVIRYDVTNSELELIDIVGTFIDNETIIGEASGAEWTIQTFSSIENENDDFNENKWFEDEGDQIVDWSEKNPFGEYANMGEF
jgi:hypothetical protein